MEVIVDKENIDYIDKEKCLNKEVAVVIKGVLTDFGFRTIAYGKREYFICVEPEDVCVNPIVDPLYVDLTGAEKDK